MILVDFSQISISAATGDHDKNAKTPDEGFLRHMIINSLRATKVKYGQKYGQVVIACDNSPYWRKEIFPYYKANRKKEKEDSKLDWDEIMRIIDVVLNEIKEIFPYPVVRVPRAEGDDVIGVLAKWSQTNDLHVDGMWEGDPKPCMIISADGDSIQNQRYPNVAQYSQLQKKLMKPPPGMSIESFIIEHIIEGDTGDGVPNVLSADNCLVEKIRQTSLKKARRAEFMEKGIDACLNDQEKKNYLRNQRLVDLSFIPADIEQQIINVFNEQDEICKKRGRGKILNYLIKNRMSMLIDCLGEF